MIAADVDPLAIKHELWRRGDLDYLRHPGQRLISQAVKAMTATISVLHAARGYGKTHGALVDCCELGLAKPNMRMIFAAPTREEAKKIVAAVMPNIIGTAPPELKPIWHASDHLYRFPSTNSTLIIEGADDDRGNHLRGPHAHYIVCDEAGFWRHAHYVVKSVLLSQARRTKRLTGGVPGRIVIQSTSPESVGHEFVGLCEEAKRNDAYRSFTVHDNPRMTEEDKQTEAEEMSGLRGELAWKATNVRRELLCEFVTETNRAVVPEFDASLHVVDSFEMPTFADTFTFLDLGLVDLTHALFCYWDFVRAVLVVVDEISGNYIRTKDFAEMVKEKERELWGHLPSFGAPMSSHNRSPHDRFSDNDAQILYDLAGYGVNCAPAIKTDPDAMIHRVRTMFQGRKIEIHRRCKSLIHQLQVGIYNERRTDYERIPGAGHLDGIDALKYGIRMMDQHRNPVPPMLGVTSDRYHVPEWMRKQQGSHALGGLVRRR